MAKGSYLNTLSHHAYCLIGYDAEREALKFELESKHGIRIAGNPDFIERVFQSFTIDVARDIKSLAESRPVSAGGKKIFILQMSGITSEAQNALLKLLEEPNESTHFFLIITSSHLLLPTVKSRLSFLGNDLIGNVETDEEVAKMAKSFLIASKKERFDQIKELMDDISKEKKTKQDAIDFLDVIEEILVKGGKDSKDGIKKNQKMLEGIVLARRYISDRAPSVKMLLEYVGML